MKQYSNSRLREIVEEYIHSERDRKILIRKYCDNLTIERLAEEFDISVSQVKRIIYKHSFTIFGMMDKNEPKES